MKVLILDDSKIEGEQIRLDVVAVLGQKAGINIVHEVENAQELLNSKHFDLGIFDIRLKSNALGTDFLKSCRQKNIPLPDKVIFCSNYADEKTARVVMDLSSSLLPKGEIQDVSPLVQVLKSMYDPLRKIFEKALPGNSEYARQLREILYLACKHPSASILISGVEGSGKTYVRNILNENEKPKSIFVVTDPSEAISNPSLKNRIFTHHVHLKPLSERLDDLEDIANCVLAGVSSEMTKRLDSEALDFLKQHTPDTMGALRSLLLMAVVRSRNNYYITRGHLCEGNSFVGFEDFDLSSEQFEKLESFCLLVKKFKDKSLDQIDVYKQVSRLREPVVREDYEREYGLKNLPSRSTLHRILDQIRRSKKFPMHKGKMIHDVSLREAVSFRK